jgi:hypothetical protein
VPTSSQSVEDSVKASVGKDNPDTEFVRNRINDLAKGKDPLNAWELSEILKRDDLAKHAAPETRVMLLKKITSMSGLYSNCWNVVVRHLAASPPAWAEQSPKAIRTIRMVVEDCMNDVLEHNKKTVATKHDALEEAGAVSFERPKDQNGQLTEWTQYGQLGAALNAWNELVGYLAPENPPTNPGDPKNADSKLPPTAKRLKSAVELVDDRLPNTLVAPIVGNPDEIATSLGVGADRKDQLTKLLQGLRKGPSDTFGQPLRAAFFLTSRKEQLEADLQQLNKLVQDSLKELDDGYGKLAKGGLSPEDEKATISRLNEMWADLQRWLLSAAILRREAEVLNDDLAKALNAVFAGVRENVRNMTDTLEVSLGLHLEQVVRAWDKRQGAHNVTLRLPQVVIEDGNLVTKRDRDAVIGSVKDKLIMHWGQQPPQQGAPTPIQLYEAAFNEHAIERDRSNPNLIDHKRPDITQRKVMEWVKDHNAQANGRVSVELFGHRIIVNEEWNLSGTGGLSDLLIVATEVELGPTASFAIPDNCSVTILTHVLTQKSAAPVPTLVMLEGKNASFNCFSSQYNAAPQFVRVFGQGRFNFVGDGRNSEQAWTSLVGASKPIHSKMTEFWLKLNDRFVTRFLKDTTYSKEQKIAALLELMSVPRVVNLEGNFKGTCLPGRRNGLGDLREIS